jgi:hypothetical protein
MSLPPATGQRHFFGGGRGGAAEHQRNTNCFRCLNMRQTSLPLLMAQRDGLTRVIPAHVHWPRI